MPKNTKIPVSKKKARLTIPEPYENKYTDWPSFEISKPGRYLVMSDLHIPFHIKSVVDLALRYAKNNRCVGIILNGDIMDYHEISSYQREPDKPRYLAELEFGKQFIGYLRQEFKSADIWYKDGNHEARLWKFIIGKCPEFFGFEFLTTPKLLEFEDFGIQYVPDSRRIHLGKLTIIHGHELGNGGASSPVNPARGLYLKAKSLSMCGHHHRTSYHRDKDIRDKDQAAWSLGCLCNLQPQYLRFNQWNHGFAIVELSNDKNFTVQNLTVTDGEIR